MKYKIPIRYDTEQRMAAIFDCPLCGVTYELPFQSPEMIEPNPPPNWVTLQHYEGESDPCAVLRRLDLTPKYRVDGAIVELELVPQLP